MERELTGEGVTLVGSDMVRVLEEVLPARFGGGPHDFQLLEEVGADGLSKLVLLADPRLDLPSEGVLVEAALQAIAASSDAGGLASSLWRQARTLHVRRERPRLTDRGKFLPIRVAGIHDRRAHDTGAGGSKAKEEG